MRKSLLMLAAFVSATLLQAQKSDYFEPYKKTALRLPSVPLLVNDPYFSFWSPYDHLYDGTTKHWDNQQKAMDGLLRVDGQVYRFMGTQRSTKLMAIAPMGNKGGYTAKVRENLTSAMTDTWMNLDFEENNTWRTQTGPWGTKGEYPYIQTAWGGDNTDRYIRRHVTITAEDLKSDLWIIYSHDDKCEIYVNGIQIVATDVSWKQNVKVHLTGAARASLVEGDNVIAFHVHNTNGGAQADIGLYKNALGFHPGYQAIAGAGMADEGPWEAKVKTTSVSGTAWTSESFDDESWQTGVGAFGSKGEYPNVNTNWTATGSDYYIRRYITLTAEDLQQNLALIYSHDDVCQAYINGRRVVSTGNTWVQNVIYNLTDADKAVLHEGQNVIAYHVHNTTGGALADIGLYANATGEKSAKQAACSVLPTSTYYTFTCGGVDLDLVFTAPFLMDDIELMSTPINFISYQVRSNDEQEHDVQFYFGTTPEMTVDNNSQATVTTLESDGQRQYIKSGSKDQKILGKAGDLITIDWGYLYLPNVNGMVSVADQDLTASTFVTTGRLPESTTPYESSEEGDMPQLSFAHDFGTVAQASSYMMFGYDEIYDMRYMDVNYKGYWARNGKTIQQAFAEFQQSYDDIMTRCKVQDQIIYDDGLAAGNAKYAEVLCASYRQCIAAHKIFEDKKGNLLFFSKENNSNGCVNTVDLTYPSAPLFLLYNTDLMKGMCTSILDYCESDRWGFNFAAHDLGTYPHANNQVYAQRFPGANGEFGGNMPIEESANIVILAAAISNIDGNTEWADRYWKTLTTWTNYLVENGTDPENQLCTDDFAGHLAHNANLAVKAIMGVAGYALLCWQRDDMEAFNTYMAKAKEMATAWVKLARDGNHYKLAYDRSDTWSQKYNMVWDKAWQLNLFSDQVKNQEYTYYLSKLNTYGLPLDSRSSYTKSDWEMWTAALARNNNYFLRISDLVWKYVNETPSRVPLSDWYFTDGNGSMAAFRARSVVGGHWMKVYVDKMLSGDIGTGIGEIKNEESRMKNTEMSNGAWYDLSGRKVVNSKSSNRKISKGIYIKDGKKVVK
ncbi:MAG: DUF4965 domain-containing protein [Bacteroidaceae bacterium]|nr:DUF4965 domain-containing protein [Bacteroidaceae bacterium]